jgi:hypothetical protein
MLWSTQWGGWSSGYSERTVLVSDAGFFWGYLGGGLPPAGHTQQSGEPDCRGPEAKPHQRDTPNTPDPGGAHCPDQKKLGGGIEWGTMDSHRCRMTPVCLPDVQSQTRRVAGWQGGQ